MDNMFKSINDSKNLLRETVYETLLHGMQIGTIVPGQTISLVKLSEKLNISKTPLRDALLELQAEGFVSFYPQRGVVVNVLSEHDINELYEICGLLDSNVVKKNFHKITEKHLAQMEAINQQMSVESAIDFDKYNELNFAFHGIYLELDDNAITKKIIKNSRIKLFQFSKRNWGEAFQRTNFDEHQKFIEIIKSGNIQEAEKFIKEIHWSLNW